MDDCGRRKDVRWSSSVSSLVLLSSVPLRSSTLIKHALSSVRSLWSGVSRPLLGLTFDCGWGAAGEPGRASAEAREHNTGARRQRFALSFVCDPSRTPIFFFSKEAQPSRVCSSLNVIFPTAAACRPDPDPEEAPDGLNPSFLLW